MWATNRLLRKPREMLQTSDKTKVNCTCEIDLHVLANLYPTNELKRQGSLKWLRSFAVIVVVGVPQQTGTPTATMTTTKNLSTEELAVMKAHESYGLRLTDISKLDGLHRKTTALHLCAKVLKLNVRNVLSMKSYQTEWCAKCFGAPLFESKARYIFNDA